MSTIKSAALSKAIAFLKAAGATYHIVDSDGNEVANTITTARKKRAYKHLGYSKHYSQYLQKFTESSADSFETKIAVPEEFNLSDYRAALSAALVTRFGRGNSVTQLNRAARTIDVMVVRAPEA